MTKKLFKIAFAVMTTLLIVILLWEFRIAVAYLLISVTIAAALRPLVKRLDGKSLLIKISWILLYLVILAIVGFLIFLAVKTTIVEIQNIAQYLLVQNRWKLPEWLQNNTWLQTLTASLPTPSKFVEAITGSNGQLMLTGILGMTQGLVGAVTGTIVILLFTIYWIINQVHFERLWLSLLPSDKRKKARGIWRTIEFDLGAYIRSQVFHSISAGVLLGLGYWAFGSPYPALLALVGALACFIPVVGAALAVIFTLFVGLLTGVQLGLLTFVYTLVVLVVLAVWVKPFFFSRKWDNPILTLILLIVLANVFGLIGIIIAPPLSAVCQILWELLVKRRMTSGPAVEISDLKARQEKVWNIIHTMDEPPPELVLNSIGRLNQLIEKAEPVLQADAVIEPAERPSSRRAVTAEDEIAISIDKRRYKK